MPRVQRHAGDADYGNWLAARAPCWASGTCKNSDSRSGMNTKARRVVEGARSMSPAGACSWHGGASVAGLLPVDRSGLRGAARSDAPAGPPASAGGLVRQPDAAARPQRRMAAAPGRSPGSTIRPAARRRPAAAPSRSPSLRTRGSSGSAAKIYGSDPSGGRPAYFRAVAERSDKWLPP